MLAGSGTVWRPPQPSAQIFCDPAAAMAARRKAHGKALSKVARRRGATGKGRGKALRTKALRKKALSKIVRHQITTGKKVQQPNKMPHSRH